MNCRPLPTFTGKTCDDLAGQYINVTGLFWDCSDMHAGLVKAVEAR